MSVSNSSFTIYSEPYATGSFLLCLFGMASNSLIIAATLRKNSGLREKSNWLICILAIVDFLSSLTFLYIPFELWLDWTFVTNKQCFLVASANLGILGVENLVIMAVSLDRLLILTQPLRHTAWELPKYVALMITPGLIYGSTVIIVAALTASDDVLVPICFPPTALNGVAGLLLMTITCLNSAVITLINILCYRASKNQPNSASEAQNRLRGSVMCVGLLYCVTQMVANVVGTLVMGTPMLPSTRNLIFMYLGWLVFINTGSNAIIYAVRSEQYRKAFKKVIGIHNRVAPTPKPG